MRRTATQIASRLVPLSKSEKDFLRDSLAGWQLPDLWSTDVAKFVVKDLGSANAQDLFVRAGILLTQSGLEPMVLDSIQSEAMSFVSQLKSGQDISKFGDFVFSDGRESYVEMASRRQPTVAVRSGIDDGMVDIFHADRLFSTLSEALSLWLDKSHLVEKLVQLVGRRVSLTNANIYLNEGVAATRGFHVDSYGGKQFKVFIYLTDVLDMSDGPYCYVPGTVQEPRLRRVNTVLNSLSGSPSMTDISAVGRLKPLACLSPKGSLIVSNQSGAHRGYPQAPGSRRGLLVLNFM